MALTIVFVHGWSVTNLDTYGSLPTRLAVEGKKQGVDISVKEIFLGRYISFHDEVRVQDISRAFRTALADQLGDVSDFICITHSTGGPVIRDWWDRYCKNKRPKWHMTHLIMLAPANFGSALAQLGKGTFSRLSSWFKGVEPGQGVLDWLCVGSAEAWNLNLDWILNDSDKISPSTYFPFVLTGQSIDRQLYDALNSYTGETGSDGVVRVAAANLESTYIKLSQPLPEKNEKGEPVCDGLKLSVSKKSAPVALRVISKRSHSGKKMGIMFSVGENDEKSMETINAILDCIRVKTKKDYDAVVGKFKTETAAVKNAEHVEVETRLLLSDRYFIHDRYSMIIFRVTDSEGYPVTDYDLLLTAGDENDPNHLPEGFFVDRQQNRISRNTVTYFVNYDIMDGCPEVTAPNGDVIRAASPGIDKLGIRLNPRPDSGFVKYLPCTYSASKKLFNGVLNPDSTTMIDIVLQRIVDKEVFRLEPVTDSKSFKNTKPGNEPAE